MANPRVLEPNVFTAVTRRRRRPTLNPPGPSELRITEEGIERITEDNQPRVTEG